MKKTSLFILLMLLASSAWSDKKPVRVQPLGELLRQPAFSAPASVKPLNAPSLAAEINGRVEVIPVRVGDRVKTGDLLIELDCRYHRSRLLAAKAELQQIEAQLKFARTQLRRAEELKDKRSISDEVLDQRRTELLGAQADRVHRQEQIRQVAIDVERCTITAPFDAVVTERLAQVGGLASPGTPLLNLIQLKDLEVSAELRGFEAVSLQQAASLHFSYAGTDYAVRLRRLLPVINGRTRTQEVRLTFEQESAPAGAAGRLVWQGLADEMPADYLVRRNGSLGVFLAEGDSARFHALPDAREGQPVRLTFAADERLVTDGRQRLQDGDAIEILKEQN